MKFFQFLYALLGAVLIGTCSLFWRAVPVAGRESTTFDDPPHFVFTVAADVSPDEELHPGSTVSYTFLLTNTGALPVVNVEIATLMPRFTTIAPDNGNDWQCAPPVGQPNREICRTAFPVIGVAESRAVTLPVLIPDDFPPDQETLVLEATATADNVVCGDCGYVWCETPIIHGSGELDRRILLPLIAAMAPSR